MKPKVTIGVCVRNSASTLREAIESIMAQDYPHELMEVIFVDDGSVDETPYIIREYASRMDIKVRIFHHKWKGLGPSRNVVINNASGDYIIWVDGDIILSKEFVRKQVEFMEQNPSVAVAVGKFMGLPQKGLAATLENMEWMAIDYLSRKSELPKKELYFCGGSIYRTITAKKVGGFDDRIRGAGEDKEIIHRLKKAGWLVSRGADVVFYEKRKNSWKALWNQYFWYGYSSYYIPNKEKGIVDFTSLYVPFLYSKIAYTITRRKIAFLMLFEYYFKAIASFFGFVTACLPKIPRSTVLCSKGSKLCHI